MYGHDLSYPKSLPHCLDAREMSFRDTSYDIEIQCHLQTSPATSDKKCKNPECERICVGWMDGKTPGYTDSEDHADILGHCLAFHYWRCAINQMRQWRSLMACDITVTLVPCTLPQNIHKMTELKMRVCCPLQILNYMPQLVPALPTNCPKEKYWLKINKRLMLFYMSSNLHWRDIVKLC